MSNHTIHIRTATADDDEAARFFTESFGDPEPRSDVRVYDASSLLGAMRST